MNDVNNRIFKEFTEFFDNVEKSASEISVTMAYEITMKSTISTAIIVLESEGRLEERYWNHLRVQNNILDRAAGQAANAGCRLWHSTGLQGVVGILRK